MVRMSRTVTFAVAFVLLINAQVFSQTQEVPKLEVGVEFATLNRDGWGSSRTEPGLGGRVTYNINRNFAVEGAGYFFPRKCFNCVNNGRMVEAVGGVKVGKRFESWGIFVKARPGIVSFTEGDFNVVRAPGGGPSAFQFEFNPVNAFATDLGGVLEFYPSKRIVTRFDAGDTILHFGRRTHNTLTLNPITQAIDIAPFTTRSRTTHNFQFTAGVGFRF